MSNRKRCDTVKLFKTVIIDTMIWLGKYAATKMPQNPELAKPYKINARPNN